MGAQISFTSNGTYAVVWKFLKGNCERGAMAEGGTCWYQHLDQATIDKIKAAGGGEAKGKDKPKARVKAKAKAKA